MSKRGIILILFASIILAVNVSALNPIIPDSREVEWSQAGVDGGIPSANWSICSIAINPGASVATIQNALNNCPANTVVFLPEGVYNIGTTLIINRNNITLRGEGADKTILRGTTGLSGPIITISRSGSDYAGQGSTARTITSGIEKGSTSITTSVAHGFTVGDYVVVDQRPNIRNNPPIDDGSVWGVYGQCGWCGRPDGGTIRVLGQWARVVDTPSSTTAIIEPALFVNYNASDSPQAIKVTQMIQYIGIENLRLDGTISQNNIVVRIDFLVNSWIDGIHLISYNPTSTYNLDIRAAFRNTFRNSYYIGTGAITQTGSQAYGMRLIEIGTSNLIENNVFEGFMLAAAFEGGWGGNVIAYNYVTNLKYADDAERSAFPAHATYPFMNLFEGNYLNGSRLLADNYFGNSAFHTLYRNKMTHSPYFGSLLYLVDHVAYVWYNNMVGNVFGKTGVETVYEMSGQRDYSYSGNPSIYRFGYEGAINSRVNNYTDPKVKSTSFRWGNWDSVTGGIRWNSTELNGVSDPGQNIPPSTYLFSKPTWFGNLSWPAYGPDPINPNVLLNGKIPAQKCYEDYISKGINFSSAVCYNSASYLDTRVPIILNLVATANSSSGTVSWITDKSTNASIEYGETVSYGLLLTDISFTTLHSFTLNNLFANKTYYYRIRSSDSSGNSNISSGLSFWTKNITHPADTSFDSFMDSSEFTLYNQAYKLNLGWRGPASPSSSEYSRSLLLFKRGISYKYDSTKACPLCWVSD